MERPGAAGMVTIANRNPKLENEQKKIMLVELKNLNAQ